MAKKRTYTRWAIAGECGLYVGQRFTRRDAIAEHVADKFGVSEYAGNGLDTEQLAAWQQCQKLGDKAVKVKITIL